MPQRKSRILPWRTPEARFWKHLNIPDDPTACWEWTGSRHGWGYGQIMIDGWPYRTHVYAWMLLRGPIPDGLCVLHECDNPPCSRIGHLFLGTQSENKADQFRKGRILHGTEIRQAVLTEALVKEMRDRHAREGLRYSDLSDIYGFKAHTIRLAILRQTWKHVV